jgi:hypothetical protein
VVLAEDKVLVWVEVVVWAEDEVLAHLKCEIFGKQQAAQTVNA